MKSSTILILTAILIAMPTFGAAKAGAATQTGVSYQLLPGSSFEEGCIAPCMCPVASRDDLTGTFTLAKKSMSGQDTFYRIRNISWEVTGPGRETVHTITGTGIYRYQDVGNANVKHQLTLDLRIDGGRLIHLDSGYILGCSQFPMIGISVRQGTKCFDISMDMIAAPTTQPN